MDNNIWDKLYKSADGSAFMTKPFDAIVSFLCNVLPKDKDLKTVKILELGCGSGINLSYPAELGCDVYGIDISLEAVNFASNLFKEKQLKGSFFVLPFDNLNFDNDFFDIIIDHGALVCINKDTYIKVIDEVYRVLKKGGVFFTTPHSDIDTTYMNLNPDSDKGKSVLFKGSEIFVNQISINEIVKIFNNRFRIKSLVRGDRTSYTLDDNGYNITNISIDSVWNISLIKK